ncbi:unnamed protein product, partial [Timema podura]|nr:unnamed protein product [Timema podura]
SPRRHCLCSRAYGFPNNLETYGLISGLWTSTFALGAFIGPSLAGILYDSVGFRKATMFVVGLNLLVCVVVVIFVCCARRPHFYKEVTPEDVKLVMTASNSHSYQNSCSSHNLDHQQKNGGVSIDRPPGMTGIIATNSYKNRHGTWHRRDSGAVLIGPYSASYGSIESRGFLESVA